MKKTTSQLLTGCGKKIMWTIDPETGKKVVNIPHCTLPNKLLEIGEAICEACFIDCDGKPVTDPACRIEIKDGKLLIPGSTTDFEIKTGTALDECGKLVECPEQLIITPLGKDPLPPIWLNPVRTINGEKPDKSGNVELKDCCHYLAQCATDIDPKNPPAQPPGNPDCGDDKSDGDTLNVRCPNGNCHYLCIDGKWVLQWCEVIQDCCHYQVNRCEKVIDPEAPPEPPAIGKDKSDGDTLHVCYKNADCYYTCVDGEWVLDFCKAEPEAPDDCCHYHAQSSTPIDPENPPAQPPEGTGGDDKSDGDTASVCHPNGMCYYTCVDGAWTFDYCKVDPKPARDCCTFFEECDPYDAENPPTEPQCAPENCQNGDTLIEKYPAVPDVNCGALGFYCCVNGSWQLKFLCPLGNCKFDEPVEKITRVVCGKTRVPFLDQTDPDDTAETPLPPPFTAPSFKEWTYGGVTIRVDASTTRGGEQQGGHCLQHGNFAPGGTATWSISGLDSLDCDDCKGCAVIQWGAQSLDNGVLIDFNPARPVQELYFVDQNSPTSFTGNGDGSLGHGHVWFEDQINTDGTFSTLTSPANSPEDNLASCLKRIQLFRAVKVTETSCDEGETWEFTSAVDGEGNTYTQSQVNY